MANDYVESKRLDTLNSFIHLNRSMLETLCCCFDAENEMMLGRLWLCLCMCEANILDRMSLPTILLSRTPPAKTTSPRCIARASNRRKRSHLCTTTTCLVFPSPQTPRSYSEVISRPSSSRASHPHTFTSHSRLPPPLSAALESLPRSQHLVEEFELFELPDSQYPYPKRSETSAREAQRERQRREKLEWLLQKAEMKFSHSLQFNAVPDWSSHYIAYSNLKKLLVACCLSLI
jgi:hypothetical protein